MPLCGLSALHLLDISKNKYRFIRGYFVYLYFSGSFIFLTIEGEDSAYLQQQRTLASTKRNVQTHKQHTGSIGTAGLQNNMNNNIYHTQQQQQQQQLQSSQQQQQQQQHFDNATINAPASSSTSAASSSSSSSSSSASASSASSTSSASSPQMLEGMISLQNNDFGYGDDFTPQYALSPDTFDVRQRTIENIWDITVSLNILYKENWTK